MSGGALAALVLVIVVVSFVAFGLALVFSGRAARSRLAALQAEVDRPGLRRKESASFYGVESASAEGAAGTKSGRELGVLAATDGALFFRPLIGEANVDIERSTIDDVTATREFWGKAQSRDLLRVTWTVDGTTDRAAWRVADLPAWTALLTPG